MALGGLYTEQEALFHTAVSTHNCVEQPEVEYKTGVRGYQSDFAWPGRKVVVEIDGWEYHGQYIADFNKTYDRRLALEDAGWKVISFTASMVNGDPKACVLRVLTRFGVNCPGCNGTPLEIPEWKIKGRIALNPEHVRFNAVQEIPPPARSWVPATTELPERFRRFVTR